MRSSPPNVSVASFSEDALSQLAKIIPGGDGGMQLIVYALGVIMQSQSSIMAMLLPIVSCVTETKEEDESTSFSLNVNVGDVSVKPVEDTTWQVTPKEDSEWLTAPTEGATWYVEPRGDEDWPVTLKDNSVQVTNKVEVEVANELDCKITNSPTVRIDDPVKVKNDDEDTLYVGTREYEFVRIANQQDREDPGTFTALQIKNDIIHEVPVPLITAGIKNPDGSYDTEVKVKNWPSLKPGTDVANEILTVATDEAKPVQVTGSVSVTSLPPVTGTVNVGNSLECSVINTPSVAVTNTPLPVKLDETVKVDLVDSETPLNVWINGSNSTINTNIVGTEVSLVPSALSIGSGVGAVSNTPVAPGTKLPSHGTLSVLTQLALQDQKHLNNTYEDGLLCFAQSEEIRGNINLRMVSK